ncbi:Bifunctional dethiobiotin synthetase/7,8-diamino-pelargonic acid aminotransferase, mitochondrial [Linum perenne]
MLSLLRPAMLPSSRFLLCHHYTLSLRHLQRRLLCSSSSPHVPLSHPTYMIWSSNTSLGKTLVSTGLASSFLLSHFSPKHHRKLLYLKPVQTGFPSDSDSHFVFSRLCSLASQRSATDPFFSFSAYNSVLQSSPPAANAFPEGHNLNFSERQCNLLRAGSKGSAELVCETLYAWKEAVSPHLAAERENFTVSDSSLVNRLEKHLTTSLEGEFVKEDKPAFCIVETAGGVASPGPSGTLQCDLYRPFRLPGILVGDGRLGGISGTVSAYESLKLRGYDVVAVVFVDHGLANEDSLQSYFRNRYFDIELAREMGYAAGRFGHVMFPENVYEPSLECAQLLLEGVGKGWASRVFFSDNGSTAIEIALKMAFRKFCFENGMLSCVESSNTTERSFMLKVGLISVACI